MTEVLRGDTQNKEWVEKRQQSFGYRMMMKMGWKEDTGLGKEENGSLTHIRIKKRADNVGIGAEADVTGNSSLTSAVSDFNSILQSLSQYHAPAVAAASDTKERRESKSGKKASLAHSRVTFKKRAVAKDLTRYSAEDKAAIFCGLDVAGGAAWGSAAAVTAADTARADSCASPSAAASPSSAASSESDGDGAADKAADKAARKAARAARRADRAERRSRKREREAAVVAAAGATETAGEGVETAAADESKRKKKSKKDRAQKL